MRQEAKINANAASDRELRRVFKLVIYLKFNTLNGCILSRSDPGMLYLPYALPLAWS